MQRAPRNQTQDQESVAAHQGSHFNKSAFPWVSEMPTLTSRKYGGFEQKIGRFSKLHATSMAQNLPEIGRLPNLDVKMGQKCLQNRDPPYQTGRVGISGYRYRLRWLHNRLYDFEQLGLGAHMQDFELNQGALWDMHKWSIFDNLTTWIPVTFDLDLDTQTFERQEIRIRTYPTVLQCFYPSFGFLFGILFIQTRWFWEA